ncbi:hypothetical protein O9992_30470 [Vibrio lentus]|nr:hypothetical protein [Vibrio lentus]
MVFGHDSNRDGKLRDRCSIDIARKQMSAQDQLFFSMPKGPKSISSLAYFLLGSDDFRLLARVHYLSLLIWAIFVIPDAFEWSIFVTENVNGDIRRWRFGGGWCDYKDWSTTRSQAQTFLVCRQVRL